MIDEKEKKLVKKYSILPKIASASLIMAFVLAGVWLILVMISDIGFKSNDFKDKEIGMYTYFILTAIYLVIFAYSFLRTHIGMRSDTWKNIVDKVVAEQDDKDYSAQMAGSIGLSSAGRILKNSSNDVTKNIGKTAEVLGAIGTVATSTAIANKMSKNAKSVAKACNIKIPKARKYIIPLIIIPILILIATHIPGYIRANDNLENEKKVVSEIVYKLQSVFEKECERVRIDDPYERYQDYGYTVSAQLSDDNYIYITVGNDGKIEEITYNGYVDIQISKEENIENIEKVYSQLHKILMDSGVDLSDEMIQRYTLSDEFKEKFLDTPYNEKVVVNESPEIRICL